MWPTVIFPELSEEGPCMIKGSSVLPDESIQIYLEK